MSQPSTPRWPLEGPDSPHINDDDRFGDLVEKLSLYFYEAITLPHTFEELRMLPLGRVLNPLVARLVDECHHPAIVCALLALKAHFSALEETSDEPGVNEARGYACELVAWQFLSNLTEAEVIDFLLHELPTPDSSSARSIDTRGGSGPPRNGSVAWASEETPMLQSSQTSYFGTIGNRLYNSAAKSPSDTFSVQFENLTALEIAAVANAKKFLSQRPLQKIINGLWRGEIVFWDTLDLHSIRCPKVYSRKRADPFCRLRVPRYMKIFETIYFTVFLALYYAVLVRRNFSSIQPAEVLLYIWIVGFAYDEFGDWIDAGQTSFYASDFWWMWDISIVVVGAVFCILRIVGLKTASHDTIDLAYDVLGLEALFLVPRIFSLLSLNSYVGTLIPCLKEMTKDFVKFLSLVVILYFGFLTTFVLLARGTYKPSEMSWILIKVFFGSSYLGFDVAQEISPYFGPPVMLVFVALTNILLITSLISLLSNSLSKVLQHAREEYLFIYSVYVLEASTSNRLTYFLPPLNLIPLLLRPLRLVLPSERLRSARIWLLKITHWPLVGAIWAFERITTLPRKGSLMGRPDTPCLKKRTFGAMLPPARSPATGFTGFSGSLEGSSNSRHAGKIQHPNRPRPSIGQGETEEQMKSLVVKLAMQVEELTAIVAQLQHERQATTVA